VKIHLIHRPNRPPQGWKNNFKISNVQMIHFLTIAIPNKAGAIHELPLLDCHLGSEFLLQGWVIQIPIMPWVEKRISTKRQDRQ
jgi:hypothetical protein